MVNLERFTFISVLQQRFEPLHSFFERSWRRLLIRDNYDPSAILDTVATNSVKNCLKQTTYRGFGSLQIDRFSENVYNRSRPFRRFQRNKVKALAASLQLTKFNEKISPATLNKAAKLVTEHLELGKHQFSPCTVDEAVANLKGNTSAGFPWFEKKKNVTEDIVEFTNFFLSTFSWNWEYLFLFPAYVAYRVQQRPSDVKLRLIYVYSAPIVVMEQLFLVPLLEHFLSTKTPYVIGNSGSDLVLRWSQWQSRSNIVSIDWSTYDWSASALLIGKAFHILKDSFRLSHLEANVFDFVTHYFINTPIITNLSVDSKAQLIKKVRGIPSGSSFTNLIGSIVNLLALYCYLIEMGYEINPKNLAVLGDDIIYATNNQFSLQEFGSWAESNLGMFVSIDKSDIYKPGDRVYFLGAFFDLNGRYCNPELLLYQICTTTSNLYVKCNSSRDHAKRIWDKTCSICFKYSDGFEVFDEIWPYVEAYLGISYFSSEYTEVMSRATVPGSDDQALGNTRSFWTMRNIGWLIQ